MYFVYIVVCLETGRSYVGQTDNLIRRFKLHCKGLTRTTRNQLHWPYLAHWESFGTRQEAVRKERYFKSGSGHRVKRELIDEALVAYV